MNAKTANEIPISALHLSARTYNALSNDGIETVADLVQYSHQDLLSLRNFGRRSLYEVEAALAGHSAALAKAPGKKQPAYAALIKATLASRRERRHLAKLLTSSPRLPWEAQ
jgi:DNA-directed RNA polymerase alpha subunit